jgi:hypothetical protein
VQGGERGQEQRSFEFAIAGVGGMFTLDRGAEDAGGRGDAGVGGQVG